MKAHYQIRIKKLLEAGERLRPFCRDCWRKRPWKDSRVIETIAKRRRS